MAFFNTIPAATDRISDSQAPLLANFVAIGTVVAVNHVTFDDPSGDQGKHKFVSFPEQAADPVTPDNEAALYSKVSTLGALGTQLFFAREGGGDITEFTSSTAAQTGWTRLPSGILLKWGFVSGPLGNGLSTFVFPVVGTTPAFSAPVFSMQLTPYWGVAIDVDFAVRLIDFDDLQFRAYISNRTTTGAADGASRHLHYLAIGI